MVVLRCCCLPEHATSTVFSIPRFTLCALDYRPVQGGRQVG